MKKVTTGEPLSISAEFYNGAVDAIQDLKNRSQKLTIPPAPRRGVLCRVVTEGPEEESDYEDHRYWVQEIAATDATFDNWGIVGNPPFTAINLAELHASDVWQHHLVRDRIDIDDESLMEYGPDTAPVFVVVFSVAGQWVFSAVRLDPIRRQWLHITAFGEDGAPTQGFFETAVVPVLNIEDVQVWPLPE